MSALRFGGLRWHRLGLIQTVRCCGDRNWYNVSSWQFTTGCRLSTSVEVLVIDACEPDGCGRLWGKTHLLTSNSFGRTPGSRGITRCGTQLAETSR